MYQVAPFVYWQVYLFSICFVGSAYGKPTTPNIPKINPNFVVNTVEVDNTNTTILEQKLVFDIDLRRSMMYGYGTLVKGAMQQIRRCDIHPEGWMISAGGPDTSDPSTWQCTNTTINAAGELPWNCQYSTFWSFPDDMKYAGNDVINETPCDKWVYFNGGDEYALWATQGVDASGQIIDIPVANGKTLSATGGNSWTIYYYDFVGGTPADSEYTAIDGLQCPESTPP